MFAFKDLFPRAFEVLTQDVELKESEKIALQKLHSCQKNMNSIQQFFKKPVCLKRKAPSTCTSQDQPTTLTKTKIDEKEMNVLLAQNVLKEVIDAGIVMNTTHSKPNPPDPSLKYPTEANMHGLYIGKLLDSFDRNCSSESHMKLHSSRSPLPGVCIWY